MTPTSPGKSWEVLEFENSPGNAWNFAEILEKCWIFFVVKQSKREIYK